MAQEIPSFTLRKDERIHLQKNRNVPYFDEGKAAKSQKQTMALFCHKLTNFNQLLHCCYWEVLNLTQADGQINIG